MAGTWKRFFNLIAFIAVIAIGLALMLSYVLGSNEISGILSKIAEILAYIVVAFYSFFYAWTRSRGTSQLVHMILWAVAVVLIIVFIIL